MQERGYCSNKSIMLGSPTCSKRHAKKCVRIPQKSTPRNPKIALRSHPEDSKIQPGASPRAKIDPKRRPGPARRRSRAPKTRPRRTQGRPRAPKRCPRSLPGLSRGAPGRSADAFEAVRTASQAQSFEICTQRPSRTASGTNFNRFWHFARMC